MSRVRCRTRADVSSLMEALPAHDIRCRDRSEQTKSLYCVNRGFSSPRALSGRPCLAFPRDGEGEAPAEPVGPSSDVGRSRRQVRREPHPPRLDVAMLITEPAQETLHHVDVAAADPEEGPAE